MDPFKTWFSSSASASARSSLTAGDVSLKNASCSRPGFRLQGFRFPPEELNEIARLSGAAVQDLDSGTDAAVVAVSGGGREGSGREDSVDLPRGAEEVEDEAAPREALEPRPFLLQPHQRLPVDQS